MNDVSWPAYCRWRLDFPPSDFMKRALESFVLGPISSAHALDLGSGPQVDVRYLLEQGFGTVISVDSATIAREYAMIVSIEHGNERFRFFQKKFSEFPFPKGRFRFVTSNLSLPYHGLQGFEELFSRILESLDNHGTFACSLFGSRDYRNGITPCFFIEESTIRHLFEPFGRLTILESYGPKKQSNGSEKISHTFSVILQRS